MKRILTFLISAALLSAVVASSNADVVVDDNFNRADGSLVGTSPTPGPGGVWTNHSGTAGDLLISSGQAMVQHGVPSEDAHTLFADQTAGTLVAIFDIIVNDDTPIAAGDSEYFAHFMQEGTFTFLSRLYVVPANDSNNDYSLGLSTTSGGFTDALSTDFTFGNTVNVTLTFDFATGLSSLTTGTSTISTTTNAVLGATQNSFALRQSDSSNNETVFVDNLVVSIVPEPGSLAVLGLIGLVGLAQRRRK